MEICSLNSSLNDQEIEISLAHRGRPWENGYPERFIRTLKEEEIYLNDYDDITDAKACIGYFIEHVYNRKRPHSALDYLTPIESEEKLVLTNTEFWSKKSMTLQTVS